MTNSPTHRPLPARLGVPATFVALMLLFAWSFQAGAISLGLDLRHLDSAPPALWVFMIGMSFSPALAGLTTHLLHFRTLRGMGWRVQSWRHVGLGVLGAFGLVTAGQALALALGGSTYDAAEAATRAVGFLGGTWAPDSVLVPLYVVVASVAFTLPMAVFALGEELGWSGVLVPNLARRWSYPVTSALFGCAWFLFHLPLVLFAHYALNAPLWYAVPAALLSMVLMAFPLTYLRLVSGSIWPGVLFHGMLNAAGVYVYGEVLSEAAGPLGVFLRGEGGLAALAAGLVVAALLTRRAAREPGGQVHARIA